MKKNNEATGNGLISLLVELQVETVTDRVTQRKLYL